jgi:signal transduction histidine kinase
VGIKATIENIDEGKLLGLWRDKAAHCCIWSNIIGLRPTEEWVRTSYTSKGIPHHFEDAFIEKKYQELTQAIDPQERNRIAREIGDHLFEEFADIPMGVFANEVMVNPKVVGEWLYPGTGAGRTTHFHMLKAAP